MIYMSNVFLTTEISEQVDMAKEKLSYWDEMMQNLGNKAFNFVLMLIAAIVVAIIGKKIIKFILKFFKRSFEKTNMDEGVLKFLLSVLKLCLYSVLLLTVISLVGIQTTSFAALIGSAGVTVGLALQGSLANFAGGILILVLKPFSVGDYIIASENEGTVIEIDIFYTKLLTVDNQFVVIPNGNLSNCSLTNVTAEDERRLDLYINIDYSENIKRVRKILLTLLEANQMIIKDNHQMDILIDSFEESSIKLGIKVWVATEDYWNLKRELMEDIKEVFDENQVVFPYNQLDVNLKK